MIVCFVYACLVIFHISTHVVLDMSETTSSFGTCQSHMDYIDNRDFFQPRHQIVQNAIGDRVIGCGMYSVGAVLVYT